MHIYYPQNQLFVLLYSLAVGVALGILFDVFKIKREFFGVTRLILFFDDLVYMLICTVVLILGVFKVNNGKLRWYELLAPAVGFIIYRLTLSKLIIAFFYFLSSRIKKLFKLVIKFVRKLLNPVLKLLERLCVYFMSKAQKYFVILYMSVFKAGYIYKCKKIC